MKIRNLFIILLCLFSFFTSPASSFVRPLGLEELETQSIKEIDEMITITTEKNKSLFWLSSMKKVMRS